MSKDNNPTIVMGFMMVTAHLLALALIIPFGSAYQSNENPNNPAPLLLYIVFMLMMTGLLLLLFKYKRGEMLKYFLYFAFGLIIFNVLVIPLAYLFYYSEIPGYMELATGAAFAVAASLIIFYALKKLWYVTNAVGILVAAGAISILGVNFSILPIFIFLVIIAIYDYIAVFKTKHMLTLADGVINLNAPILLSVPKPGVKLEPGQMPKVSIKESIESGVERDAMYMGLGDVIIPGLLVISALAFLPIHGTLNLWGPAIVSLGTMAGIMVSYVFLAIVLAKGKPLPGLPFLNTGAIVGYAVSYLIIYQNLNLGMSFSW